MYKNILMLLTVLCLLFVLGCKSRNNTSTEQRTKTLYQKILERGSIRVGYVSYPPSFIVNSDKTFSGIFYEVLEKIGENLGLKIEYVQEVSWDNMIETIKSGKIDMVCTGIWPTSQRGKHVDFANPFFYSIVKAYTYAGNQKFDNNLSAINSPEVKISSIDGEMTSIIANMDFPKAIRVDMTFPHLLYHYELEYPALINPASTGIPVGNFTLSCLINSSGVR